MKLPIRAVAVLAQLIWLAPSAGADNAKRVWPVPDWQSASPESQGMDSAALDKLKAYLQEKQTRQALVIRHGRIVGEWYWRDSTSTSALPVFSVTKSFTSTAVGLLVDDKKLRLDQPAADFIPMWRDDDRKAITIRHLVSMTSGLQPEDLRYFLRPNQVALSLAQPSEAPPGTKWLYNNLACNCLTEVVSRAADNDLDELLWARIFEPLGIKSASMEKRGGRTLAYMGLHISARDLARFGYLFLNEGDWNGKRILSKEWVRQATHRSQSLNPFYGYLWWVAGGARLGDDEAASYAAIGLYGNYLCVIPKYDLILVRLIGNGSGRATDVDLAEMRRLVREAILPEKERRTLGPNPLATQRRPETRTVTMP